MSWFLTAFRLSMLWSLTLWLGGFTFYSAAVIPELHAQLGNPFDAGLVTQAVTDSLNIIGLVTISLGWTGVGLERRWGDGRRAGAYAAIALLASTTACLVGLILLHRAMDRRLESDSLTGFYALHRRYLWLSTLQWLANLGLLGFWADVRGGGPSNPREQDFSSLSPRGTG